jgi:two-component system phosphate regulon response regulator PhoB
MALVIEDDTDTCDAICLVLEAEGYRVTGAYDGESALDQLRQAPAPMIVLVDWLLPAMSGVDLLQMVAADAVLATRHAYILMTASGHRPEFARLVLPQTIHVALLNKPFELNELFRLLTSAAATLHNEHN